MQEPLTLEYVNLYIHYIMCIYEVNIMIHTITHNSTGNGISWFSALVMKCNFIFMYCNG